MPAYVTEAIEAGLVSPPPDEEAVRKIFCCDIAHHIVGKWSRSQSPK